MKILALDLGKFNTMACFLNPFPNNISSSCVKPIELPGDTFSKNVMLTW